jgi:integrase
MPKTLTAAAVKNHHPGKSRREIPDGGCPGLHLVIQPSGRRSWAMRFRRPDGKSAKLTLGPVDLSGEELEGEPAIGAPLTLASARRLAAEIHRERARGRDVVADRNAAKRRRKTEREARVAASFSAAAIDFVEGHAQKKTRRWQEQARLLGLKPTTEGLEVIRNGLADRWTDKPVASIDGHDIHGVIDEVRSAGVPGLERRSDKPTEARARAVFACLSKMFGWLAQHRRVEKNPCAGVHRPDASLARDRVLADGEVAKFWSAASAERGCVSTVLKLLLLTGCRLNEVAGMRRSELTADGSTWAMPGARTKNRRPHVVPLPQLAAELIASVPGKTDLIFTTTGCTPISGWSKIKQRLDGKMDISPWRLHDLRRTAATGMAEIGVPPHIVEATLNHVSGARAGVAGTYNRAAYAAEKRLALERWAEHVESLVTGHTATARPLRASAP